MLKADFHVHTILSKHHFLDKFNLADGLNTPEEMVRAAAKNGLDCIAITDHNVLFDTEHANELSKKYGIVVLPGIELYLNKKDVIAIGLKNLPLIKNLIELKREVNKQGGILIAPHPDDPLGRGCKEFEYFDAIEVVNGFGPWGFQELIKIAEKLEKAQVCGSDSHCVSQIGWVYCLVDADPNANSIISAVKNRKTTAIYGKLPKKIQIKYYYQKYIKGEAIFKPAFKRV